MREWKIVGSLDASVYDDRSFPRNTVDIEVKCERYSTFTKIYEALKPILEEERIWIRKKIDEGKEE